MRPPPDAWALRHAALPVASFNHPTDSRYGVTFASPSVRRRFDGTPELARLEWIRYRNHGWAEMSGATRSDSHRVWWFSVGRSDRLLDAVWRALVNFDVATPGVVRYMTVVTRPDLSESGRYIHVETPASSRLDVFVPREDPLVFDFVLSGSEGFAYQFVHYRGRPQASARAYIRVAWNRSWVYRPVGRGRLLTNT